MEEPQLNIEEIEEENYQDLVHSSSFSTPSSLSSSLSTLSATGSQIAVGFSDICFHEHKEIKDGVEICTDCGTELQKELSLEPEWRFYKEHDTKSISDPSRCHLRKLEEKTIRKDLEQLHFPEDIVTESCRLYDIITHGETKRGKYRQALLYASTYFAFKNKNMPQIPSDLGTKFKLQKKDQSKGLKQFQLHSPASFISSPSYENFIPEILKYFKCSQKHIDTVITLYRRVNKKSKLLQRSNPQSVIAGTIYYYFTIMIGGSITPIDFSRKVGLSYLTILKISKDIGLILEQETPQETPQESKTETKKEK